MKVALDTNILVYFFNLIRGPSDDAKGAQARHLLLVLGEKVTFVVPTQVYGELYSVAVRFGRNRGEARDMVTEVRARFAEVGSEGETLTQALDLASDHKLQFWDALILNAAADAGCSLLLSEDFQPGFTWRGVTVVNPFAAKMDGRLKRLMAG